MLQCLTSSGDLGDSEAMELKVGIDEIIHNLYLDEMGCEEHDLQPDDRVDDVLDLEIAKHVNLCIMKLRMT